MVEPKFRKRIAKELKITVLNPKEKPGEIRHKPLPFDKLFKDPRSLILVEDDESVARAIQYLLETEPEFNKLQIHIAKTLEEAKIMPEAHGKTAIIITDMSYPEKTGCAETPESGVKLIRYIKERYPEIKIIADSGREDYLEKAKKAGADFTILKSEVATKLVDIIKGIQTVKPK